jgi:predicted dehydrogenase
MYANVWRDRPELGVGVAAVWDHDAQRLARGAQTMGARAHENVADLLADAEVEAVVIAAETSLHAELVEQAAAAGKPIVLQKPIALTMAQADRIVAAVERAGVPFTMAWQMRVDPQNLAMKELLASGELGRVFMVRRRHGLGVHTWPNFVDMWHNDPAYNRDIFADDAAHAIDFLHWLLGVPASVSAELSTLWDPRVPHDNGIALFRYPDGTLAEAVCSFVCPAGENTTEVVCERGTIIQNYGDVPSCNVPRPEGAVGLKWYTLERQDWIASPISSPAGHGQRIGGLAEPLALWLHGQRPAIATAEEGRLSLRMVLACYVSARAGRRVSLDDPAIGAV